MTEPIKVLLADDENLIRSALAMMLSLEDDIVVVAEAESGEDAVIAAAKHQPHVAVLDLQMAGIDGIETAQQIAQTVSGCVSIIVTSHGRPGYLKKALSAGVRGFLPKTTPAATLARWSAASMPVGGTSTRRWLPRRSAPATHRLLRARRTYSNTRPTGHPSSRSLPGHTCLRVPPETICRQLSPNSVLPIGTKLQ